MNDFTFIDLFAGVGGFHQAMEQLGGKCVFASEIDKHAISTYKKNYNIEPQGDIREIKAEDIPKHDVLCSGFPCQSFSIAGCRNGFDDETRGTLFFEIERILKYHHTKYIILENVKNLTSHDKGRTWKIIESHLHNIGYRLTEKPLIVSPHHFGTPQLRERVIILGIYDPDNVDKPLEIDLGDLKGKDDNTIYDILDEQVDEKYNISAVEEYVLQMWDDFYQGIDLDVIGFPIWYDWFKQKPRNDMSEWKKRVIQRNNQLYERNKDFIDSWSERYNFLTDFTGVQRKFEWQAGNKINSIWDGLIQFRQSGIRVKAPNCFPTLVAIVQTPIIGKYKRRLTVKEAARLQNFTESFILNENERQAYKQLGNAVNVKVVKKCMEKLFEVDNGSV